MQKMKDGRVIFSAAETAAFRSVLDTSISVVENMNVDGNRGTGTPEEHLLEALENCIAVGVNVEGLALDKEPIPGGSNQ